MASEIGTSIRTVVPSPGSLSIPTSPSALDSTGDDVHPDAAAADVGYLLARRKAGVEDEFVDIRLLHREQIVAADDSLLDCRVTQFVGVDPATVVLDFDHDVITFAPGAKFDRSARLFACVFPFLGGFDTVVDSVADDMHQRIPDLVEDRPVDFHVLALHIERDTLVLIAGDVPDEAWEFVDDLLQRNESDVHHRIL